MANRSRTPNLRQVNLDFSQAEGLPFSQLLSFEQIKAVLENLRIECRDRIYNPAVTLWMFLSQTLSEDHSCRETVARLLAWRTAKGHTPCSADNSSYCQARARLPVKLVSTLARQVGRQVHQSAEPSWLWKGRKVKIVDGTTVTMPDSAANRQAYPPRQLAGQSVGFPIARVVILFSLACGTALELAFGATRGKATGETTMFRTLLDNLQPDDIVVGDRLFDSYRDLAELRRRGVDVLVRMHGSRRCDFRRGRRLGKNDHVVVWKKPWFNAQRFTREAYDALPNELKVRELRFGVRQPGFRTRTVTVVTTLLDAATYPIDDLAALYRERWNCELDLNALKTTLQMEHLRCQSPAMVEKELWTHMLGYNLMRQVMAEAARKHHQLPRHLSFKGAVQTVNAFVPYLATSVHARNRLLDQMFHAIARHIVGDRPDRVEPRKLKLRQDKYTYLNQSRAKEREQLVA